MITPNHDHERKPAPMPLAYAAPSAKKTVMTKRGIAWALSISFLVLLATSIILRFLIGPREQARDRCASNLRQIGQAIQMYAMANNHRFPPNFSTLLANSDLTPDVFNCPNPGCSDTPASGATRQAVLADFAKPGHCSYLYFGAGMRDTDDPMTVVASEPLANHNGQAAHFLFLDGHVEFIVAPTAKELIAGATTQPTIWWQSSGQ